MKWLKTLFGKQQTTSTGEEQEKLDRAFRVGQEAAQSMVADLDGFIDSRFGHLKEAYLDILATGVRAALSQDEHSPILIARAELAVFNENVTGKREEMAGEIMEHMREWEAVFEQMGEQDQVARVMNARLDDLLLNLTVSGIDLLTKHADALKIADDSWRKKNPALAAQEPLEL